MALIIEETGRYLNIRAESSLEPGFSNLVLRDYEDKQARDLEKQHEEFKAFLLSSLEQVANHFYSELMEEIERVGYLDNEILGEEETLMFLRANPSVEDKYERNQAVIEEIAAIQEVMERREASIALVPINIFEHLKDRLLQFDIATIDDFIEAIIGSSPHFDEMGLGFTDRCFLSIEAAYEYIKDIKLISPNFIDDI